jgi:hypothetical protein
MIKDEKQNFYFLQKWRATKDKKIKKKKHFDLVSFLIFILAMLCLFGLLKFFGLRLLT